MRHLFVAVVLSAALIQIALPLRAAETYDLIFKTGTLSDVSQNDGLVYDRVVSLAQDADLGARNTGIVALSFEPEQMARLQFAKDEKFRNLGAFPATVGNPIIMYFVETVLRDVAQQAGGSPFYVRNRIKEALVQSVPISDVSVSLDGTPVEAHQITLRPFEDDKNRDRMRGFGDLTLTFTMSSDVPGWYQSLVATVASGDGKTPIYKNALTLQGSEVEP